VTYLDVDLVLLVRVHGDDVEKFVCVFGVVMAPQKGESFAGKGLFCFVGQIVRGMKLEDCLETGRVLRGCPKQRQRDRSSAKRGRGLGRDKEGDWEGTYF
jgi:hypothetical protein